MEGNFVFGWSTHSLTHSLSYWNYWSIACAKAQELKYRNLFVCLFICFFLCLPHWGELGHWHFLHIRPDITSTYSKHLNHKQGWLHQQDLYFSTLTDWLTCLLTATLSFRAMGHHLLIIHCIIKLHNPVLYCIIQLYIASSSCILHHPVVHCI